MAKSRFNLLNIAKSKDLFSCFVADPGHKLVYLDFNAVEPHVCAHLTQDKNLMKVYGKGMGPNDVYLHFGSHAQFAANEVRQYYDPDAPTKESIKLAKSKLGMLRGLLKTSLLAMMYGAYPKRLYAYLRLLGYKVTMQDCQLLFDDFHDTYRGLKAFERRVVKMWGDNGGYIINGRGLPMAIAEEKLKDINNTIFQSTGHQILMSYLTDLNADRITQKVPMTPYLVDVHDSTTWQVPADQVDNAVNIFRDGLVKLNARLNWTVEIKGDVKVGNTLADFLDD